MPIQIWDGTHKKQINNSVNIETIAAVLMGTLAMLYMPIITISLNSNPPGVATTEIIQSIRDRGTSWGWKYHIQYCKRGRMIWNK